jgi:hypothetical protein
VPELATLIVGGTGSGGGGDGGVMVIGPSFPVDALPKLLNAAI